MATPTPVVPTKSPEIDKTGPVRKFSNAAIQGSIDRALAILPASELKTGDVAAVVVEGDMGPDGKPQVSIAFVGARKLGPGVLSWEAAGLFQWNERLDKGVKARVAYVF